MIATNKTYHMSWYSFVGQHRYFTLDPPKLVAICNSHEIFNGY